MTQDELERRLLAWGRAYGEERAHEWDEDASPTGCSPTARGLSFAPGTATVAARRLSSLSRAGRGRRALMAAGAGVEAMRVTPSWACDPVPVPASAVRGGGGTRCRFTPDVEQVESAWLALRRFNPLQAECLRLQYQVRGTTVAVTQREKANMASRNLSDGISLKRYRDELRYAKTWMHARLSR
jgi:hypothetical protein